MHRYADPRLRRCANDNRPPSARNLLRRLRSALDRAAAAGGAMRLGLLLAGV